MVENVKITLLICLTCIASGVLILSYGEYTHRYELIATQNNGVYIFDRKTTTLNKCENGRCDIIKTNFPTDPIQNQLTSSPTQAIALNTNNSPSVSDTNTTVTTPQSTISTSGIVGQVTTPTTRDTFVPLTPTVANPIQSSNNQLPTLQDSLKSVGYTTFA